MQLEINHLRRKLHCKQRRGIPSRTSPNESFSCDKDHHYRRRRRSRSLSHRGLGNDAMSRALCQISKSSFTQRIEGGKLHRWFTQPTFTMYNGRTDHVEHVGHFNQRMKP